MRFLPNTGNDQVNTVYVRPNGDDTGGTGTLDHPYATFRRAIERHVALNLTRESVVFDITGVDEGLNPDGLQFPFNGFAGEILTNLATPDEPFERQFPLTIRATPLVVLDDDFFNTNFVSDAASALSANNETRWDLTFAASSLDPHTIGVGDFVVMTDGEMAPVAAKVGDVITVVSNAGFFGTPTRLVRTGARLSFGGTELDFSAAVSGVLFQGIRLSQVKFNSFGASFEGCYMDFFTTTSEHTDSEFENCALTGNNNIKMTARQCLFSKCMFHEIALEVNSGGVVRRNRGTQSYETSVFDCFFRDTFGIKVFQQASCLFFDVDLENMTGGIEALPGSHVEVNGVDSNLCKTNSLVKFTNAKGLVRDIHGTTTGPYALELLTGAQIELEGTNTATGATEDLKNGAAVAQTWASVSTPEANAAELTLIY